MVRRLLLIVLLVLPALAMVTPAANAGAAPAGSFVTLVSENGDFIGQGSSLLWYAGRDTLTYTVLADRVGVSVDGAGGSYTFGFSAPDGQTLHPGSYQGAERMGFQGTGLPGIEVTGEHRGCNTILGSFTVREINASLGRLWLTYEQHCEGGRASAFGEIRMGMPAISSNAFVAPGRVVWPSDYPGVALRPVPVNVVNTGGSTLDVGPVSVVAGGSDFNVLDNGCAVGVQPGARCTIQVGFTPSVRGDRNGVLRVGQVDIPLRGFGIAGKTSWDMTSQPGDYIGQGQTYHFTPQNGAEIAGGGGESHAFFRVDSGGEWFTADFGPARGQILLPGTYSGALRYGFSSTSPGLDVSGDSRGCNQLYGSFTVAEVSYGDASEIESFKVSFTQHCEQTTEPALTGTIAYRASDPNAPALDTTAPAAAAGTSAQIVDGGVAVSWTNPATADWANTIVRGQPGTTPPATAETGTELYTGRGTSTTYTGLPAGAYSIAVFTRDTAGNLTKSGTATVPGSRLTLAVAPRTLVYGDSATLTGTLTFSPSASSGGQRIDLQRSIAGAAWSSFRQLTTASDGTFAVDVLPAKNTRYRARYAGAASRLGSSSAVRSVTVATRISLSVNRTTAPVGTPFVFSTQVLPAKPGAAVVLQRQTATGWTEVSQKPLDSTSRTTFSASPAKGTWTYRIFKAADTANADGFSRTLSVTAQ